MTEGKVSQMPENRECAPRDTLRRAADGTSRWYCELSMLRHPLILFTTWKVLGVVFGAVWLVVLIASAASDALYNFRGALALTWGFVLMALLVGVIAALVYLLLAACCRWRSIVLYELDDTSLRTIQTPLRFGSAQAEAWLDVMTDGEAAHPGAQALLAATRGGGTLALARVKSVAARPRRGCVRLRCALGCARVYAAPADFDAVCALLAARCRKGGAA